MGIKTKKTTKKKELLRGSEEENDKGKTNFLKEYRLKIYILTITV